MSNKTKQRPIILVVEDEGLIAMMIAQTVEDAGYAVAGPARGPEQALALLASGNVAGALLDVSIGAEMSFSVADELASRGTPFVFMTGYSSTDLPAAYRAAQILAKPLTTQDILCAIETLGVASRD